MFLQEVSKLFIIYLSFIDPEQGVFGEIFPEVMH